MEGISNVSHTPKVYHPPLDTSVVLKCPSVVQEEEFLVNSDQSVTFLDDETGKVIARGIDLSNTDLDRLDQMAAIFSQAVKGCARCETVLDEKGNILSKRAF